MSLRDDLIEQLKDAINTRESTSLTVAQVSHYIGSDMETDKLKQWVSDTINNDEPVTADDVLSLCEGFEFE